MRKLFALILCVAALSACTAKTPTSAPAQSPTPTAQSPMPTAVKTMIAASDVEKISKNWTVLGEVGLIIDGEYTDIILATEAKRGRDGFMEWDDSQQWRLVAMGEEKCYSLFDGNIGGVSYIDVTMEDETPTVKLINSSTVGITVTEFTYNDGAFYAEELIGTDGNGNQIYNSFPEYYE